MSAVRSILGAVRRILDAVRSILGAVRSILGAVRRILGAVRSILGAVRRILDAVRSILCTVRSICALLGEGFRVLGVGFSSNYGRGFLFPAPKVSQVVQSTSPVHWSSPVIVDCPKIPRYPVADLGGWIQCEPPFALSNDIHKLH